MKQYLLGTFTGFMISALVGYFLFYPIYKKNWRDVGEKDGSIKLSCELYKKTEKLFGAKRNNENLVSNFTSCKEVEIVVVEKNGILTIRTR
jgi:hypothetical protein